MTTVNLRFEARQPFVPYLNRKERWAAIVAHRRAGKTVACIMDLIAKAIQNKQREPRYAYVAPTYTQAKDVAWSYLKEYTQAIPGIEKSESELTVTFPHNGARIRLYGAENYDRLRGLYLDGAIIDEAGDIDPRAYPEVIRPALSDRRGWATFIGTPKGRNEFYRIFERSETLEDWYSDKLKASKTGLISVDELNDAKRSMTKEQFAQEYECSFDAAIKGAYYGQDVQEAEDEGRIGSVPHDKSANTFSCWDLGIGDAMAIWIGQLVGREIHWINHYENNGFGLDHYVDWINGLKYRVDTHYLPHDGDARELQTGKSRKQYLEGRGFECVVVPRHNVDDGINAVRMAFNRMWFDKKNCEKGIDCLRMYQSEFDEKHQVLKSRPLHNWASHSADALRCGVMGMDETKEPSYEAPTQAWVV